MLNTQDTKKLDEILTVNEKEEMEIEELFYKLWEDDRL